MHQTPSEVETKFKFWRLSPTWEQKLLIRIQEAAHDRTELEPKIGQSHRDDPTQFITEQSSTPRTKEGNGTRNSSFIRPRDGEMEGEAVRTSACYPQATDVEKQNKYQTDKYSRSTTKQMDEWVTPWIGTEPIRTRLEITNVFLKPCFWLS